MIDYVILGALTIRDMSGYEIRKLMSYSTAFFSNVSFGSIYPTLKKFEKNGLVICRDMISNGRHKKVYAITDEGKKLFNEWSEEPLKPFIFKYEMLVRLFYARNIPREKLIDLIKQHLQQIDELAEMLEAVDAGPANRGSDEYQRITLRFGRDLYSFIGQWYRQLLIDLEKE